MLERCEVKDGDSETSEILGQHGENVGNRYQFSLIPDDD
jgi:hypothetical protein